MTSLADRFPFALHCHRAIRLAAPAASVWAVVGDVGNRIVTGDLVERVDVQGVGAGALRTYHFPDGASVIERIEEHDPELRRYVYRIIDVGPLPCAAYLGLVEVMPAGPNGCILSWSAMARPIDAGGESLKAMIDANLVAALKAVSDHFTAARR